jgi:hypothetical protein
VTGFPITFNVERNVLVLDGQGGATVMLGILLKAKFGDAFDPETLFHGPLAELMVAIKGQAYEFPVLTEAPFDHEMLGDIAAKIVADSFRSGWWAKSHDERVAYLQNVVVAPYKLSDEQLDFVLSSVESALWGWRRVVEAADAAGEPR